MIVFGQICFVCCLVLRVLCDYEEENLNGYHYQKASPEDIMVDVINNFGLALLEVHNEGNGDNMALSPYGATSVLIALKEGIRGYASREIENSVRLPADLSIIRIGLRDVHRHLKSYFIPKEGFLAGLTLSNDKVELLQNYENILRFYGYDLESFNNPLYPDAFEDTVANTTSAFEIATDITNLGTTNLVAMSVTPETTVTEEYKNITETTEKFISTTDTTVTATEKADQKNDIESSTSPNESSTSSVETTIFTQVVVTEQSTKSPKIMSIQNQVTKNTNATTSNLSPSKYERTIRDENKMTTQSLQKSSKIALNISLDDENMETMSSVTEIFTVRSTLPIKPSTDDSLDLTTNTVTTFPIITDTSDNGTGSVLNTVSTMQIKLENLTNTVNETLLISTTPMQTEFTTPLEENLNSNNSNNVSDSVTADSFSNHVVSVNSTNFSHVNRNTNSNINSTEDDEESTTNIVVTSITTSVSTSTSKSGQTTINDHYIPLENTTIFEKPLTTEDISKSETTTVEFNDSSEARTNDYSLADSSEEESSYFTDSIENSTNNEIFDDNLSGDYEDSSNESDYDYSTENITEHYTENDGNIQPYEVAEKLKAKRKSRSIVDYLIARYQDNFHANNRRGRQYDYEPEESLSFFVYGRIREPNINFMNYDAVLPFAYLPVLDALALSFPLDSSEYYLLLILPVEINGIDRLVYDLKRTLTLREIISNLNFTHVKAIIPSFMLKGYVILTSTLQKLGIRKIFEPRHTDFSPLTKEKNLYVTNIEQAVTVTIRSYIDPEKLHSHRNLQQFETVEFKADHPFLYFVMDSRIHVTLMAGKIINPLNSRIR